MSEAVGKDRKGKGVAIGWGGSVAIHSFNRFVLRAHHVPGPCPRAEEQGLTLQLQVDPREQITDHR